MKFGFRTPNPTKMIKARTTGKIKRAAKKTINPVYGKKGLGLVNNPKKSIYNKVYNKTTKSVFDKSLYTPKEQSPGSTVNPQSALRSTQTKRPENAGSEPGSGTAGFTAFVVIGCALCGNWIGASIFLVIGGLLVWFIRKEENSNETK